MPNLGRLPNFMGIINWEGCQNLLGRLSTFIGQVAKLYWEGCQNLLGRLSKCIGKVTKLYGQMEILIYNTFYQLPILSHSFYLYRFCHPILILLTTTFKENI